MKVEAIIQVRTGSTRLPRKVLMKLNSVSVLQCLFNQLSYSKLLHRNIIATTVNQEDNVILDFAKSIGVESFRGSSLDVLDRYYQCAKYFSIQHIARITSDCPLIDPEIVDRVINIYEKGDFDYVNNFYKKPFPSGTEVEVFSFDTLEKTWKNASKEFEREHVTLYIYNNPDKFSIGCIEGKEDYSQLHLSIDRIEDLELVKSLYEKIHKKPILFDDILKVLKDNPSLLEINKNIKSR